MSLHCKWLTSKGFAAAEAPAVIAASIERGRDRLCRSRRSDCCCCLHAAVEVQRAAGSRSLFLSSLFGLVAVYPFSGFYDWQEGRGRWARVCDKCTLADFYSS